MKLRPSADFKTIALGSESDIKIRATKAAFEAAGLRVDIIPCKAESEVGIQPVGTRNMENGARNRARYAKEMHPEADLCIGIENGLVHEADRWFDPTCVVIITETRTSTAFGAFFPIPEWMVNETLTRKTELGEIVKERAGGGEKDSMKYLSDGMISREQLLTQAILCALAPFLYRHRYKE